MAEHRTRALVLRTFDLNESDRVVHLYTETLGRVSAIAKGARRSRRRFPGTLELLFELDVRLVDPPRAQLLRLESARLVRGSQGLPEDLGRFAVACLLAEVLDRVTAERDANPDLFAFAVGVLGVVAEAQADALLALLVLAKTLARLGYRPQLAHCAACGEAVAAAGRAGFDPRQGGALCAACAGPAAEVPARLLHALERGLRMPLAERAALGLSRRSVLEAFYLVERFFRYHLDLELRSLIFLRQRLLDSRPVRPDTAPPLPGVRNGEGAPRAPREP